MTDYTDLVKQLRNYGTDWNGEPLSDNEPARVDPTAGVLRQAADAIEALVKERDEALKEASNSDAEANHWHDNCIAEQRGPGGYPVFWQWKYEDAVKERDMIKSAHTRLYRDHEEMMKIITAQREAGEAEIDTIKEELEKLRRQSMALRPDEYELLGRATNEIERLRAGGCARDQTTTQFCAEAVALQAEVSHLEAEANDLQQAAELCLKQRDELRKALQAIAKTRTDEEVDFDRLSASPGDFCPGFSDPTGLILIARQALAETEVKS